MGFPANAIGLGSAAVGGWYYGSHGTLTTTEYILLFVIFAIAVFFGLILS